jgi:hypothetical protein
MAAPPYPPSLTQFPPDLLEAVAHDAAADAELVALVLDALGLRPTGDGAARVPLRLPAFFLLALGAALRMVMWEERGLHAHRDAGLPPAHGALREVARALVAPEPHAEKERAATELVSRVLAVTVERLAWNGRPVLGADVAIDGVREADLLEALADFLWAHRPRESTGR